MSTDMSVAVSSPEELADLEEEQAEVQAVEAEQEKKTKGYKPSHPPYFASVLDAFGKGW